MKTGFNPKQITCAYIETDYATHIQYFERKDSGLPKPNGFHVVVVDKTKFVTDVEAERYPQMLRLNLGCAQVARVIKDNGTVTISYKK